MEKSPNQKTRYKKQGYVVITPMLFQGDVMIWSTEDDTGQTIPIIFDTVNEAQTEMIEDLEVEIQQFKDGEREFNDIDFEMRGQYVATIDWTTEDELKVFNEEGNIVVETTLKEWQQSL